jgi:hypothetical protein
MWLRRTLVCTDKMLIPLENYGIKCMSMGFLMEVRPVYIGPEACCADDVTGDT